MSHIRTAWLTRLLIVAFVALVLGACGGGDDDTADTGGSATATTVAASPTSSGSEGSAATAAAGDSSEGECAVTVSGFRDESWSYPQAVTSFSTDYWLSDDSLEAVADTDEESFADQMARGAQIVTLLQISCSDPQTFTNGAYLAVTNETTRSDVPMGPGSYEVTGGLTDATGPVGTVFAEPVLDGDETYDTVVGSGSLDVTSWEPGHIEGTFAFDATPRSDPSQTLHVEGSFNFVCQVWFDNC